MGINDNDDVSIWFLIFNKVDVRDNSNRYIIDICDSKEAQDFATEHRVSYVCGEFILTKKDFAMFLLKFAV